MLVSLPGVVTTVTSAKVGAVVSMVKLVTLREELAFPAESVTVMVQLLWAAALSVEKVTVLLPLEADVVELEQSPP